MVSGMVIAVMGLDDEDDDDEGKENDVGKDDENEDDAEDSDDGFCFVTNAGSVVTCQ